MHLKILYPKRRPFYPGGDELNMIDNQFYCTSSLKEVKIINKNEKICNLVLFEKIKIKKIGWVMQYSLLIRIDYESLSTETSWLKAGGVWNYKQVIPWDLLTEITVF